MQTFPFILDEIGNEHRGKRFAIIIDEAHSSQGGKTSAKMHIALANQYEYKSGSDRNNDLLEAAEEPAEYGTGTGEAETLDDRINRIMESRKILANASY